MEYLSILVLNIMAQFWGDISCTFCKIGIFKKESHGNGGKSNGGKNVQVHDFHCWCNLFHPNV